MDRPLERRNATRTAVVWESVRGLLGEPGRRVLDVGGGTGGLAVHVAGLGHDVTVVDPSPDALAALARRAADDGVADRVTAVQGDLDGVVDLEPGFDLVLCHGVLGLVEEPGQALRTIAGLLAPGGALSLVVAQHHAAVLTRAMAGHFAEARALLGPASRPTAAPTEPTRGPRPERRFTAEELRELLPACDLAVEQVQGVRVFSDLVPSSLLDLEPGAAAALVDLERAVSTRADYLVLASQLHVVATR